MKILHLATDDKFIDHAYFVFEKVYPGQNDVWIISKSANLKFVKIKPKRKIVVKLFQKKTPKVSKSYYQNFDLVVFHSFGDSLYPEIFNIPKGTPTVWLGWGYDYYDLICKPENLLLEETKKLRIKNHKLKVRAVASMMLQFMFKVTGVSKSRYEAIHKITLFSPVLPEEYELVRNSRNWNSFPESARWNYGTMEDHLIKGFEGEQVDGDAILIGNSASFTCNHKETLDFLHSKGISNRYLIAPLSYGDKNYGEKISSIGNELFGKKFKPLTEFMPVKDYVATIRKCGYVIMNHKRQQAVGNIVIMLYLGARVFLREENPTYLFLKEQGVLLSSVQELEKDFSLLEKPLSVEEKETNKRLVSEYWGRDNAIRQTKNLIEQTFKLKGKHSNGQKRILV
ncbi:4-alpha-L-fucosyltransferase (Fuc4NAc transferase) [Amphritea opalescens]|uniref:4-alpha-L-fucosyltransferase (Fuc4NAc transferase) n=1 Tax=Amphritea opalescens TaxID=2490544 RepID=A0A430KP49_9GAMM|nr:TDP-N-acetylfucosamine:lipid II N-acetylfucosaminyltransferase [Amphritea opalescens]RTE65232.1 4-alpha-L-fucosyltransferase (Fuc4NAc transferase) [Amphritea opalescens]